MTTTKLTKNKNKNKTNNIKSKTCKKSKSKLNIKGGGSGGSGSDRSNLFIYSSQHISTQPNTDNNYKEIGIVHITESAAINAIKGLMTGVANIFGAKGFDNSVYDKARNTALNKIMTQIDKTKQKICNLRMEVENNPASSLFFIHLYGTLLQKKM